jgi:PAS domain S-box-containing protein
MAGLSALPGAALAWWPHAGSPAPFLVFEPVRDAGGGVLDFQCAFLNPAAEDVVRDWGLEPRLSRWHEGGVGGLEVADCVRVGTTGVPLAVPLRVRREGVDAHFQAVALKEGEGFALWLLPPVEEDAQALREEREALVEEDAQALREALVEEDAQALREACEALGEQDAQALREACEALGEQDAQALRKAREALGEQDAQALRKEREALVEDNAQALREARAALGEAREAVAAEREARRRAEASLAAHERTEALLREVLDSEREARRRAEAALAEHERAEALLREAEERYRLAARATHDVLWDWELSSPTVRWEAGPGELFGYGAEASTHGLDWWEARVHPDEREAVAAGLRDFVASTRAGWQAEYRFLRADGTWAHVLDRGVLARDGAGRAVRMIGSMMDITERHRALERLSEEARFRERFIGILGHDLRNPLNAISLSARALRRRSAHGSNPQQLAQRIETSAARMGTMISDILDLTRARLSGGIPLNLAPADLGAVCRQVVEELTAAWPERFITVDVDGPMDGVWDADRLAQVLSNLVGNALEHGAQDAPVMLRCLEQDGRVALEVHNPGAPIPAPQLATLFDPFRQAGTAREHGRRRGGLGLGLFIVREIVQAHGGSVHVSSSERDGTTFTVLLPRDTRAARVTSAVGATRDS